MLPFLCILLIFVPRWGYFLLIPLNIVSIAQMIDRQCQPYPGACRRNLSEIEICGFLRLFDDLQLLLVEINQWGV